MTEAWVQSPSFPAYDVSSQGRVRRRTTVTSTQAGRIIKASRHNRGYWQHGLGNGHRTLTVRLNRLVCEAFHGAAPTPEHQAAHIDGDLDNNSAANLYWATRLENAADKHRHGTTSRGRNHPGAKLNDEAVRSIRGIGKGRMSYAEMAAEFGVSTALISHVLNGRNWAHVR